MDEKLVRRKIKEHTPLNKRFMEKMMRDHKTQGSRVICLFAFTIKYSLSD